MADSRSDRLSSTGFLLIGAAFLKGVCPNLIDFNTSAIPPFCCILESSFTPLVKTAPSPTIGGGGGGGGGAGGGGALLTAGVGSGGGGGDGAMCAGGTLLGVKESAGVVVGTGGGGGRSGSGGVGLTDIKCCGVREPFKLKLDISLAGGGGGGGKESLVELPPLILLAGCPPKPKLADPRVGVEFIEVGGGSGGGLDGLR